MMNITRLKLKNWRNFRDADIPLRDRTYLLGANATGKSNLLDVFRFLRDISKAEGGGLQRAISERGGIAKLRCLHARRDPIVRIEVHLSDNDDAPSPAWKYIIAFRPEGKGLQRPAIVEEVVWKAGECILHRPNSDDINDSERLTETHLEQISTNSAFRRLAEFFAETRYLHLVPQMLKYGDRIGGNRLENDPFGQGFLEDIARVPAKTRDARLIRIIKSLQNAVPQFKNLRFIKDDVTGRPHLEAQYDHFRPLAGWQREEHFSDGTLRLLGLLWSLMDGQSLLLLEEPELSLNDAIVEQIPLLFNSVLRSTKRRNRQIIVSTHSRALLSNKGIDGRGVLLLEAAAEGTSIRNIDGFETDALKAGLSIADVILPKTRPPLAVQLALFE